MSRTRKLTENNILCLTENQIGSDPDAAKVLEQLSSFKIYLNSCVLDNKILQFIYMNLLFFWSMILFQSIYNWYKTIDIKHGNIMNHFRS